MMIDLWNGSFPASLILIDDDVYKINAKRITMLLKEDLF